MIVAAALTVATMIGAVIPAAAMATPVSSVSLVSSGAEQQILIEVSAAAVSDLELDQTIPVGMIITLGVYDSDAARYVWRHRLSTGWPPAVRFLGSWLAEPPCGPAQLCCGDFVYFQYQALRAGTADIAITLTDPWTPAEITQHVNVTIQVAE